MSIRSEVDAELSRRGIYGDPLTIGENLLICYRIIIFTIFILNITVWSPGMIVLFLCQRIFIDKTTLLLIIKMGLGMSFVNAILAYAYAGNGYLKWDSFQRIFQPDALNWISGVQNWWHLNLYFSIILWLLAICFALLQLIISHFASSTKEYGYGLLNIPALLTGMKPNRYLTFLQDGILGAFVLHVVGQKQFDFVGKTSIFCFAAIVMFWIVFSAFTLDVSRWETYSRKNIAKGEKILTENTRILSEETRIRDDKFERYIDGELERQRKERGEE